MISKQTINAIPLIVLILSIGVLLVVSKQNYQYCNIMQTSASLEADLQSQGSNFLED